MNTNIKNPIVDTSMIKNALKTVAVSELRRLMYNKEAQKHFKIGDVLVLKNIEKNNYVKTGSLVRKWIVSYIDEYGLIYAKRILNSGKMSTKLTNLTKDYLGTGLIYDIDPEHIESVLLDAEDVYDPMDKIREVNRIKSKVRTINRAKKAKSNMIYNLKLNDKLWTARNYLGENINEFKITKKSPILGTTNGIILTVQLNTLNSTINARITKDNITSYYKERPVSVEDFL